MSTGAWDAGRIRAATERPGMRGPYVTAHLPDADPRGLPVAVAALPLDEPSTRESCVGAISTALGQACAPVGTYTMVLRDSAGTAMIIEDIEHQ